MISGVELGKTAPSKIELEVSSGVKAKLEIRIDDLKEGKLIATIPISATGGENVWKTFSKAVNNVSGHHDIFITFRQGKREQLSSNPSGSSNNGTLENKWS